MFWPAAALKAENAYQRNFVMLKKSYRLAKSDVERTYKKGRAFTQDFILVRFLPNRANHCRFAVVIPKKVLAKAVDRNCAKRMVYNYLSKNTALWQNKNLDISFSFRRFVAEELPTILNTIFGKLP